MMTITTPMPTLRSNFLRSYSHWPADERLTAWMRVTLGRVVAASAPVYFLERFFFCFAIILLYHEMPLEVRGASKSTRSMLYT